MLNTATDPTRRSLYALEGAALPGECLARVAELHQQQYQPFLAALVELDVPQPELTMQLVLAMMSAASQAIVNGSATGAVRKTTLRLIHSGISSRERTLVGNNSGVM